MSLRDKQIASLKQILNLNKPLKDDQDLTEGSAEDELIWKVLVFDKLGQNVISPVLKVSDLRCMGITMHMTLSSQRQPIEDVPSIYLCAPTAENVRTIVDDIKRQLYAGAHINFLSPVPRAILEDLATQAAEAGLSEQIASIYDQYLNFVMGDSDLFHLDMQDQHTYWALHSNKTNDDEIDQIVDRIVRGLFSVIVTMGVIPIIRCPKGQAAEMVAQALDRKLRDYVISKKEKGQFPGGGAAASRPVLVILDRTIDLIPLFSHSWTYSSLINDVLSMKLNRITVETPIDEKTPSKGLTRKAYDITPTDWFWEKNSASPFPEAYHPETEVAEEIDAQLTRWKEESAEISKKTGANSLADLEDQNANTSHLKAAITLLPELKERKFMLDMHMNILAALLTGIKNRQLDVFYEMEQNINKTSKATLLELLKDPEKGNDPLDKLRLWAIYYLGSEQNFTAPEISQMEGALAEAGCDTISLAYLRELKKTTKMSQLTSFTAAPQPSASSDLFGRFSSLSSRLTDRLKESGVPTNLSANFESLIGGIKNLVPQNRDLTVTKIVESICEPSVASASAIQKTEDYLYFDARNSHARGAMPPPSAIRSSGGIPGALPGAGLGAPGTGASFGQRRAGYSDCIVFTVGGGSMDEFGNLKEWAARAKKNLVYGSTEILSAREFIKEELERLGGEYQ